MNLKSLNECFHDKFGGKALNEGVNDNSQFKLLGTNLFNALHSLINKGETNIKAYEVAFQNAIEKTYPGKMWWEVTECQIFWSLFNGRDPELTITEILAGVKPEFKDIKSEGIEEIHCDSDECDCEDEKPHKKECRHEFGGKALKEGTSNFWTMDELPLLIFDTYENVYDKVEREAIDNLKSKNGYDYDYTEDEDELETEMEKVWDEIDYCVLDEDEIDSLKDDIDEFNYDCYRSEDYDPYEVAKVEVELKPGYYEAIQLYCDTDDIGEVQLEKVKKFFDEMKKKYGLTELGVSYRASNGETGYHKVEGLKEASNVLSFGGDDEMEKIASQTIIKDWYKESYPKDTIYDGFDDEIFTNSNHKTVDTYTFLDLFNDMDSRRFDYACCAEDSMVRERVFEKLASIMDVDYDYIYQQWLRCKMPKKTFKLDDKGYPTSVNKVWEGKGIKEDGNEKYYVAAYIDTQMRGLEDNLMTNDREEAKEFAWEHTNGSYVVIKNLHNGKTCVVDADEVIDDPNEYLNDCFNSIESNSNVIKIGKNSKMMEIPIEDNSEVGDPTHPIQVGLRGRTNKLESCKGVKEDFNPMDNARSNIIEFPNGEYVYVGYQKVNKTHGLDIDEVGILYAGHATNAGIIHEYEIEYDEDSSLDTNLQALYDTIVEEHPEYLDECLKTEGLTKAERTKFVTELTKLLQSEKYGYTKEEANDIAIKRADALGDDWRNRWGNDIGKQVAQEIRMTASKNESLKEDLSPNEKIEQLAKYFNVPKENIKQGYSDEVFEVTDNDGYETEYIVADEATAYEMAVQSCEELFDELGLEAVTPETREYFLTNDEFTTLDLEDVVSEDAESYIEDIKGESDDEYASRYIAELVDRGIINKEDCFVDEDEDGKLNYDMENGTSEDILDMRFITSMVDDYDDIDDYMSNIYGDEWYKEFSDWIDHNIDYRKCAEYCVDMDGIAHTLATYDGDELDIGNGLLAYRTN